MFENQPELVRQLHCERTLAEHLDAKCQQGLKVVHQLKESGMGEEDAFEVATQMIFAPSDGPAFTADEPPEPVPWREQELIYAALEAED